MHPRDNIGALIFDVTKILLQLCFILICYGIQVMLVGDFRGKKVQDVKKALQKQLIDNCAAVAYYEPEKQIISR
jgi:leucyl-tRNA synthetase